jgi:hypothetical protein
MSQEQGLGEGVRDPGSASPRWSAPDSGGDTGTVGTPGGIPPTAVARLPEPVYRPQRDGIPLRPLSIGEILDGTFRTIRHNPRATIGLAAVLVTVQQVLAAVVELLTNGLPTTVDVEDNTLTAISVVGGFGGIIGTLLAAVVGAVLTGMLVVVVSEDVLGRRVGAAEVWRRIRPRIWALIVAAPIAGITPYLGLFLLVVPGLILWALWSLTTPALVLEGIGPFAALGRSARLAGPNLVQVWWTRALSVMVGTVIQLLIAAPFAVASGLLVALADDDAAPVIVGVLALGLIGSIVAGMITAPFLAGVLALLYIDRRMRAEGLDLVLRRQERLAGTSRPGASPNVPGAAT